MSKEPNSIKIVTKWIEGEAKGIWGIAGLLIIVAVVTILIFYSGNTP